MSQSGSLAPSSGVEGLLFYELGLTAGDGVVCRLLFPGDARSRGASLDSKRKMERLLQQPFLTPVDRKILMGFYMGSGPSARDLPVKGARGFKLVQDMLASGRCVWEGSVRKLAWGEEPVGGTLGWNVGIDERQEPVVNVNLPGDAPVLPVLPPVVIDPESGLVREVNPGLPGELTLKWMEAGPLGEDALRRFLEEVTEAYPEAEIPTPPRLVRRKMGRVKPRPVLNVCQREFQRVDGAGTPLRIHVGQVGFSYLDVRLTYGSSRDSAPAMVSGELVEMARDRQVEEEHWTFLKSRGLSPVEAGLSDWDTRGCGGEMTVSESGDNWAAFLAEHGAELEELGWELHYEGRSRLELGAELDGYVRVQGTEGGTGWFEFETGVMVDETRVNLLPLIHDLLRRHARLSPDEFRREVEGQTFFVPTVAGAVHAFPGSLFVRIVERIFELYDQAPFGEEGKLRLSGLRAMELAEQFGAGSEVDGVPEPIRRAARVLREGITIEPMKEPEGLKATLREYQRFGLGWLQFMARHQLNGVLADDMGLGKTLQTIAHLVAEKEGGRLEEAALLVAPTSLMRNWQREVEKFAPDLKVITLHGENRQMQFRAVPAADLVLTTYGLIRRDEEWHRDQAYSWIILDEAQFIKNPDSRSAKVLRRLSCEQRLCLTGTPVENHLGELWSLFHFLMPGFLGDREAFRRQFRIPVEEQGNEAMREVLNRRVRPFLLRRKKDEVATELPPKTEVEHPVEMTERQWEIYETVRVAMNQKIMREIALHGVKRSKIVILDALTKLRQICCDPRLAKLESGELKAGDSGKLTALMEMLPEMVAEGRRVLVFSQFTSMLKLIEEELGRAKLGYVKLTGSTKDRSKCVDRFQSGKVPLFLISLRAGGTGLNLTEADTVIHYDPWWNPQVENQATDRAYRIGQEKPVFAYKLVAADTVEERIIAMQKRKAVLAEGILSGKAASGGKLEFGEEEVAALLG